MAKPLDGNYTPGTIEETAYNQFQAATSLEQQFFVLASLMQEKENTYNRENPTLTPVNRVVVQPDYETSQVNMTVDLLLTTDAVVKSLQESIAQHIPYCP